jgi:hypothetical protein
VINGPESTCREAEFAARRDELRFTTKFKTFCCPQNCSLFPQGLKRDRPEKTEDAKKSAGAAAAQKKSKVAAEEA